MACESSYESGRQPFLPDAKRGHWAHPQDFVYAAAAVAFHFELFVWYRIRESGLICFLLMYLISLPLFIVPLMVIQSFLGQFSTSGIISAFRISPLFKGIGYVTLALNVCVLAYHSVFAMVPLLYMFASMNPTLPWSCEGMKTWTKNLTERQEINLCNIQMINETHNLEGSGDESNETDYSSFVNHHIPSVMYFTKMFNDIDLLSNHNVEYEMSWQLILCALLVWITMTLIVYKLFDTEMFGTIIRHCVWVLFGLMCLFIIRFCFVRGAGDVFYQHFVPTWRELGVTAAGIPFFSAAAFGPGWGLFISLASFNQFRTNIFKSSWLIGASQMAISAGLTLLITFSEMYFDDLTSGNYYAVVDHVWLVYLSSGSLMAHMEWANMWSILFYFMLFLATITSMSLQLKSILTTAYDEFVFLREKRLQVSISLLGFLFIASLFFTSNFGIGYFVALAVDTFIAQNTINLLLILVVLWIYGRERFQKDIQFMTGQHFSTWFVNILRFVAPLGFILGLLVGLLISYYEHLYSHISIALIAIIFIGLPWFCIPGYAIYQMRLSMGTLKARFLRCCHPTDWFPIEMEHRQKYDQAMGNAEITQTFSELRDQQDGA